MRAIIIDVETIGLQNLSIFEIGTTFIDTETREEITKGYLIDEVYNDKPLFRKAYYYDKNNETYEKYLKEGKIDIISMKEYKAIFNSYFKMNLDIVAAFNIPFDLRALSFSLQRFTDAKKQISIKSLNNYIHALDIAVLFAVYESKKECYRCFCEKNGYLTGAGNLKTTAEIVYRYVSNKPDFIESHTGMDDSKIEAEILSYYLAVTENKPEILEEAYKLTLRGTRPHIILKK